MTDKPDPENPADRCSEEETDQRRHATKEDSTANSAYRFGVAMKNRRG